jgi:DNA polymerase-1
LLPQRLASTGAKIIGTVHDEILLEVPRKMAGEAGAILKESMIHAGEAYLSRVPIEVEVTSADNWADK